MKKLFSVFAILLIALFVFASPVEEVSAVEEVKVIEFTDSCGRTVQIPNSITKIAPSGAVATMFCSVIAPEYMTNVNSEISEEQLEYLPSCLKNLPATGQLYGSKATINYEELIATGAELLIDIGDAKPSIAQDLDAFQEQIGIPCIFLSGTLEDMPETFRKLGTILSGKGQRAEELASFIEKTLTMADENSAKIKDEERVSVMFASAANGLGTNAKGSSQAQVIEIVGADNAIVLDKANNKGGGNVINMEQLYMFDPDVIVITEDLYSEALLSDPAWAELSAVKNGKVYSIPCNPYDWMGCPPSLNMILGVWWLGNTVYPQYYDYNMDEVADTIYNLFWGCDYKG